MRHAEIVHLEEKPGQRILAVSDIHANREFLERALARAGFCEDDLLLLLGDFVEKREGGLETLRYIMELSRRPNVIPLCGNCDSIAPNFVDDIPDIDPGFYGWYLPMWGKRCLLVEMAGLLGIDIRSADDYPALRRGIREHFAPEVDFLRALPTIALSSRFLFVHGGVPREEKLEELEAWRCMKNDNFLGQGHSFRRWCVVGHWPVTLYNSAIPAARPLIDREKHIISIDGGCSLKLDGQLNVLIIPGDSSENFDYVSYDGLPTVTALDAQAANPDPVNVRYAHNKLEVLERGEEFCRCRHLESGRVLDILTEYLRTAKDGSLCCEDATDYRLPVSPGDTLSVVRRTSRGILAKKDGVTGWYAGRTADN